MGEAAQQSVARKRRRVVVCGRRCVKARQSEESEGMAERAGVAELLLEDPTKQRPKRP